jgi:hypothetical protein
VFSIKKSPIPGDTLLAIYIGDGSYTDCFSTVIPARIPLSEFVFAFYTTLLFRLERLILHWIVSRPSTDAEARQLADGSTLNFAAWHVENRTGNEILMCDMHGRTRSWLMVDPGDTAGDGGTRLYFGSAVVPVPDSKSGEMSLGFAYRTLIGFHKVYSMLLLYFARSRILRQFSRVL